MELQRNSGLWRGGAGGAGGLPGGWMRGKEEAAVNFTLKLWWESSACDKDWNRDGGGWAVHSAQGGGDWSRESVRGAVCSSGEGRMGRIQLHVLLQRIVPPAAQPLNPDAPFSSFSLLFSPSAAASWVRTAGMLVRMCFLLIAVLLQDRGCLHQTGINYWTYMYILKKVMSQAARIRSFIRALAYLV